MARPIWSGTISFGLVNIPVRMYAAVREHGARFHLLHDEDHARLKRQIVCSADGEEIHPEHIVRGYEASEGNFVVIRDSELEALAPESSRAIDISEFVDADEIDPLYYERPYYLAPGEGAVKAYGLLLEAMRKGNKVGISKFVMHDKEHLAALRPVGNTICLSTMRFAEEVLPVEEIVPAATRAADQDLPKREQEMAERLLESMVTEFDPRKFKDEYRHRVDRMIRKMVEGEKVVSEAAVEGEEEEESGKKVINLMAALQESLAASKRREKQAAGPHGRGRRRSA
jgi:DNA end-binding protein Ku